MVKKGKKLKKVKKGGGNPTLAGTQLRKLRGEVATRVADLEEGIGNLVEEFLNTSGVSVNEISIDWGDTDLSPEEMGFPEDFQISVEVDI